MKLIDALRRLLPLETLGSLPPRRNGLACDRRNHAHCPVMNLGGTGCCCAYACFQRTHCSNTRYEYRFDRLGVSYLIFITLHIIDILFIFFFLRGQLIFGITSMKWRESIISPISSSQTIVTIVTRRCRTILSIV